MFSRLCPVIFFIFFNINIQVLFASTDCADMFKRYEPSRSLAYLTMFQKPSDDAVTAKIKQIEITYSSLIQFLDEKQSEYSSKKDSLASTRKLILEQIASKLEEYYELRSYSTFIQNNELTHKEMFDLLKEAKQEWNVEDSSNWFYFMTFFNDTINQVKDEFNTNTPEEALILANELDVNFDYKFEDLITGFDQQIQDLLYIIFNDSNIDPKVSQLSSDELYTEASIILKKIIAIYALQTLKTDMEIRISKLMKGKNFSYKTLTEILDLTKKLELVDEDESTASLKRNTKYTQEEELDEDLKALDILRQTRKQVQKAEEEKEKKSTDDENGLLASFYGTSKKTFSKMSPSDKGKYKVGLKLALRFYKMDERQGLVKGKGVISPLAYKLGYISDSIDDNYSEDYIGDCTGVVVSSNTIITSARCAEKLGQTGVVLAGDVSVETENEVFNYKDATSIAYYINPRFIKEGSHEYDIAVIRFPEGAFKDRLHSRVNLSAQKAEGICISVNDDEYNMDQVKVPSSSRYDLLLLKDGSVVFGQNGEVDAIRSFSNRFAPISQNEDFLRWVIEKDPSVKIDGLN